MPRTIENKKAVVEQLRQQLADAELAIAIDYKGLSVAEITELRNQLRPTGARCKVTKNTLMRIAIGDDPNWAPMSEFLKGSNAFLLLKDDLGAGIKAYQAFQKATKKTEIRGGVMEGRALSEDDIKAITELPSKEELIARIAGAINAVPTKLASGLNAVPTQVATGLNEVPAKLARALQAVAQKEDDAAA